MNPAAVRTPAPPPMVFRDAFGERRRLVPPGAPAGSDALDVLCLRNELTAVPSFEFIKARLIGVGLRRGLRLLLFHIAVIPAAIIRQPDRRRAACAAAADGARGWNGDARPRGHRTDSARAAAGRSRSRLQSA